MNQTTFFLKKSSYPAQRPVYLERAAPLRGNRWEKNVYSGISQYLNSGPKPNGYVHRLPVQIIHGWISRPQIIDILVDNADGYSFGIECKSSLKTSLRLSTWFRHGGKDGQFAKETDFLSTSGRVGIIALVMREAGSDESSQRFGAYLIPWHAAVMILTRSITTDILDRYAAHGVVYRIPTTDTRVWLPPQDVGIFRRLAEMDKKAEEIANGEILRAKPPKMPKSKKGMQNFPKGRS